MSEIPHSFDAIIPFLDELETLRQTRVKKAMKKRGKHADTSGNKVLALHVVGRQEEKERKAYAEKQTATEEVRSRAAFLFEDASSESVIAYLQTAGLQDQRLSDFFSCINNPQLLGEIADQATDMIAGTRNHLLEKIAQKARGAKVLKNPGFQKNHSLVGRVVSVQSKHNDPMWVHPKV